jgi:hypothetical protein
VTGIEGYSFVALPSEGRRPRDVIASSPGLEAKREGDLRGNMAEGEREKLRR